MHLEFTLLAQLFAAYASKRRMSTETKSPLCK